MLKELVGKCNNGVFGTMAEAVAELDMPRLKSSRPYKTYDGPLTLGDPKKYEEAALNIHVERHFMTKIARPPAASTVVEKSGGMTQSTQITRCFAEQGVKLRVRKDDRNTNGGSS